MCTFKMSNAFAILAVLLCKHRTALGSPDYLCRVIAELSAGFGKYKSQRSRLDQLDKLGKRYRESLLKLRLKGPFHHLVEDVCSSANIAKV